MNRTAGRWFAVVALAAAAAGARAGEGDFHRGFGPYEFEVENDVPYLGAGRTEPMDLYLPQGKDGMRFPAILIIHGGGWSGGHRNDRREIQMGETFAKAGFVAASIDYRLRTPTNGCWPQCIHDCKTALRFLRANAEKYAIRPESIGAIGGSAGGHLALLLAYSGETGALDPAGPYPGVSTKVKAVVDLYGIPDVALWGAKAVLQGVPAADFEQGVRDASPVTYLTRDSPPTLVMHGTGDKTVPVSVSDAFAKVLKERGARHAYRRIEDAPHTFLLESKVGDFRGEVVGFFREHLGTPK